ncbi:TetR/AcrR family transcriptional regulator [Rubellimicrobium rubrum]|uniref:TetR/AcrR family transcriptional regulator n=1 Tax=Rubellimicrobium rubrum TaxID=2585369 RepID=UPI00159BA914|nr:TetR/AcrR family transcriptional regulator [Rubellimicrobium rubrum]
MRDVGDEVVRPKRGRPVAIPVQDRRKLILDALDEAFREAGLNGTSMAAVARKAGMSKRTVYEAFEDRAALFGAYLRRLRDDFIRPLDGDDHSLPLEERLQRLLAPRSDPASFELPLAILRAMIAEGPHRPDLARSFLEEGPRAVQGMIRAELDRSVARGEIVIADTQAAAALLNDMIRPSPFEVLIDPASLATEEQIQARFELAIRVFLRGITGATSVENGQDTGGSAELLEGRARSVPT